LIKFNFLLYDLKKTLFKNIWQDNAIIADNLFENKIKVYMPKIVGKKSL